MTQHVAIGQLVDHVSTWNPERVSPSISFIYIDIGAIDQSRKLIAASREITSVDAPNRARQLVKAGDILVSTVRPNLNAVAEVPPTLDGATASSGFCVLRPGPSVWGPYLFYWVRSPDFIADMTKKATGQSYPAVSDKIVKESMIPLLPIDEQRRVARMLDQADSLRSKRREALSLFDELVQSIFFDMFGSLTEVIDTWPIVSVTELCSLVVDCVNKTAPTVDYITPYKMIRTTNVRAGKVDTSRVSYVEGEVFIRWNRRATPLPGDVILTREAPVGEVGILSSEDNVFLGQRLMLYRADPRSASPEYLLWALRSPFAQRQFDRHGSGSTVKHLTVPICTSINIPRPPLELQLKFTQRVRTIDALKLKCEDSVTNIDELFASSQYDAFSSEL